MASWEEFSQEVSMHGVRVAGSKKYFSVRRAVWLLFILSMLGYFCWSFSTFLIDYRSKLLSTQIKIEKANQLKFPTVTLCNRNLWSKTVMEFSGIAAMQEFLLDLYGDRPYEASLRYNYSDPYYVPLMWPNETETSDFLRAAALPLQNTFLQCTVFGRNYSCADVWEVEKTEGGFCFQFNSNGSLNATAAGKAGGVSFTIFTNVDEYYVGPTSFSEGFSVTFTDHHQVPMVTELGVGVSPGTQTSIVLQKSEVKRWPPPADNGKADCFDADNLPNPLHFYNNYSYSACQVECKTSYVLNKCGCRDPFQPALNNSLNCRLPWLLNCSMPAMNAFSSDPEGLAACDCNDTCRDAEYTAQVSSYNFPSPNYGRQNNLTEETVLSLAKDAVILDIFYGKMSFRILEESLAYGFHDMISNLGGTLGLCVGASILTICEFIEFAIISLSSLFKREQKTHPSVIKVAASKELEEYQ